MTPEQKRAALEAIVIEINTGLIDDETCAKRLDEIGATDEELEELM
jgi:hypothetical protein